MALSKHTGAFLNDTQEQLSVPFFPQMGDGTFTAWASIQCNVSRHHFSLLETLNAAGKGEGGRGQWRKGLGPQSKIPVPFSPSDVLIFQGALGDSYSKYLHVYFEFF